MPTTIIRRSPGRAASAGLVAAAALVLASGLVLADPASGDAHRLTASSALSNPECDLGADDHPSDEFLTCSEVVLSAEVAPRLDVTSSVDVSVTSVVDLDGAALTVLVSERLDLVVADGFSGVGTRASGVGPMAAATRTIDLVAGVPATFTIQVRGVSAGVGVVQVRLDADGGQYDAADELSTQLGASTRGARGLPTRSIRGVTAGDLAPRSEHAYVAAPVAGDDGLSPRAPGASCATGRWLFHDETGAVNGSENFQVQVWDDDSSSGDDLLATAVTGFGGGYTVCFESSDGEGGGQEVYLQLVSSNAAWRVRNTRAANQNYVFGTEVIRLPNPGTADFGARFPDDAALERALHAFDGLNRLFLWQAGVNDLAMDNPGQRRQMLLNWTPTSTDGTYYDPSTNDLHLAAADPDADHVTIHEGAHALMDALYDDDNPPNPNCNPHTIFGPSSPGCAWTEGWAEWVPARVLKDPYYRFPGGITVDLESRGWDNPADGFGHATEGRVAGALIDLSDSTNDGPWDRVAEGGSGAASEEIYATNLVEVSDSFEEFFLLDRPGEGDTGYLARAALFQNTIDYGHRDPLPSSQGLLRPSLATAPVVHSYSFSKSSNFWGVVATLPPPGVAYDLRLFADPALTTLLATSQKGPGDVEYVVVDGNHRFGTFFPQTVRRSGSGPYVIEAEAGGTFLPRGTTTLSFTERQIVEVFDVERAPGVTDYIRVVPSPGLDVDLHLHRSDGTSAGSVQERGQARSASTAEPTGVAEAVAVTSGDSDRDALVVTNESGSGAYTVYYDTTGPSNATVRIDGGNAATYDAAVTLALSASPANGDGNTPVTDVQISTDGTFDTEAWRPYATSADVRLPGRLGAMRVSVRYRNAAGAISAAATDTINRIAVPTCGGRRATVAGFGIVVGTPGPDVIVGGPGRDRIDGRGGRDVLCGLGGSDALRTRDGVRGNDTVRGGRGRDTAVVDRRDRVIDVP